MSRGPDAATLLARALANDAVRCGTLAHIEAADATRWASATFTGARHVLTLLLPAGDSATRWLAALPEAELPLRGHLLADCVVVRTATAKDRVEAVVEALTVEER